MVGHGWQASHRQALPRRRRETTIEQKIPESLAGFDGERGGLGLHLQLAAQDDGVFVEFGCPAGLAPAGRGGACGRCSWQSRAVHAAKEFLDELALVAGGLDDGGFGNEDGRGRCRRLRTEVGPPKRVILSAAKDPAESHSRHAAPGFTQSD
ncbi:MAG: hypothetical protein ACOZE5_00840 [Verrucomicrobiota bacterium]